MKAMSNELKRDEILAFAAEARLMLVDGNMSYMNDMATQKELIAFARLIETRTLERMASPVTPAASIAAP